MGGGFTQDLSRLFGLMLKLPLDVAVTTLDIFLRALQEVPALFDAAANEVVAGASRGAVPPDSWGGPEGQAPAGPGRGDPGPPVTLPVQPCAKEGPMASYQDCDLGGDDAKTIEYSITFIKPDYVETLERQQILTIDYPTTPENFKALRIAELLEKIATVGIPLPARWKKKDRRPTDSGYVYGGGRLRGIPRDDRRYIVCDIHRVSRHEIPDAEREKEKVDVLRQIRDRL